MLKRLKIENLILIKHVELLFESGFSIITGETGSGKTVLLQALKYVTGERSDADAVRKGSLKAIIEAEFDLSHTIAIEDLLEKGGISWEANTPLLLKREISCEGRSRAFINCQVVTLSLLQEIGKQLIDFTDQHAHHTLKDLDQHKKLLDLFGCYPDLIAATCKAKEELAEINHRFSSLQITAKAKDQRLQEITNAIEEISSANLQKDEEATLSSEHNRLLHGQELMAKTGQLEQFLESSPFALVPQAKKVHHLLQQLANIDPKLKELLLLSHEISMNAQELGRSISSYRSKIEDDPKRLEYFEQRIAVIDKLHRKYGDPIQHLAELKAQEAKLYEVDIDIEQVQQQKEETERRYLEIAKTRYEARKAAAIQLSAELTKKLQALNIPHARFSIDVDFDLKEDQVYFSLQANPGQPSGPLGDHASGGELSRVMIALQSAIGEKHPAPIVVFDEVDANIGGETATIIGGIFSKLGKKRQVLAITHFPQVARQADHHFCIDKEFVQNETIAVIQTLGAKEKGKELVRMLGGHKRVL